MMCMKEPKTLRMGYRGGMCVLQLIVFLAAAVTACSNEQTVDVGGNREKKTANEREPGSKEDPEAALIRQYKSLVRREGKTLELKLANGGTVKLTDRDYPEAKVEEDRRYSFSGYIEPIGYFLIGVTFWERFGYILVNGATGKQYGIDDAPVFSPNYMRFVTTNFCDAYCDSRIHIWRITTNALVLEGTIMPDLLWARATAKWESDDSIVVERQLYEAYGPNEPERKTVFLRRKANGWQLVGGM